MRLGCQLMEEAGGATNGWKGMLGATGLWKKGKED